MQNNYERSQYFFKYIIHSVIYEKYRQRNSRAPEIAIIIIIEINNLYYSREIWIFFALKSRCYAANRQASSLPIKIKNLKDDRAAIGRLITAIISFSDRDSYLYRMEFEGRKEEWKKPTRCVKWGEGSSCIVRSLTHLPFQKEGRILKLVALTS